MASDLKRFDEWLTIFGGVRIDLTLTISDNSPGSDFQLCADLYGGVLSGAVGKLVARVLKGDVRKSVENLSRLQAKANR